jgi:aryl-alcohol dehydrogenase-like predicted oxidoreductase
MSLRTIGHFKVAPIGLGCMSLSHAYGLPPSVEDGRRLIARAVELGVTHFDTAALYGGGKNEELVGPALKPHRKKIHLASKCGATFIDGKRVIDGRPETLRATCEAALKRLETDVIDLYYLHRWDKKGVPIEESVGGLKRLVEDGKIRDIGLSEVSADTIRRAHKVHPIAAVQSEYSLWTRNAEVAVLKTCKEIGAAYVAFSPVGRGFLAGGVASPGQLMDKDIRKPMPRFQEPNFSKNLALLEALKSIARDIAATPAQICLAWLLQKAPHIVPIPGTTSLQHLEENMGALQVKLSSDVVARLEAAINAKTVSGPRYPANVQVEIDTEELETA